MNDKAKDIPNSIENSLETDTKKISLENHILHQALNLPIIRQEFLPDISERKQPFLTFLIRGAYLTLFVHRYSIRTMLELLIFTLFILWILGLIRIDGFILPNAYLFTLNNVEVTLWNVLALLLMVWVIGLLPSPFSEIAAVMLILWILAILGIFAISGLSNILMIVIILGLVMYLISWRPHP